MKKISGIVILNILSILLISTPLLAQQSELAAPVEQLADQLAFANEGKVKSVSDGSIYINLGQQEGIREGMTFEVVRLGEPITSEGEIIGHQEKILGEAEVVRAREQISVLEMVKPLAEGKSVKKGDKVYQKKKKVKRIAITEFSFGDQFNQLTKNIEDRLYTAMIQRGMDVVERDKLAQVLKEQKKEWSGLFDLSSAAELGKLLGVEAVLIGGVSDQGEQLSIRARLVDVETAQAIAAAATRVKETPNIASALEEGVRGKPVGVVSPTSEEQEGKETGGTTQGVLFSDDFQTTPKKKWSSKTGTWTCISGRFTTLEREEDTTYEATVGVGKLSNYTIEVDVYIGELDHNREWPGIIAGQLGSGEHKVVFWLGGDNGQLHRTELTTEKYLVQKKRFNQNNPKSPIHVKIEVNGPIYTTYVNGEKVSSFSDPNYQPKKAKKVGLILEYHDDEVYERATFDNFKVTSQSK